MSGAWSGVEPVSGPRRAWLLFRSWPLAVQILLWVLVWPALAALALLGKPRRATWHLVAAVALLVAVGPAWGAALIAPGVGEPGATAASEADEPAERAEPPEPASAEDVDTAEELEASGEPPASDPVEGAADEAPREDASSQAPVAPRGELEVHFLDVGQADATLLLHDEVAVLVDTGHWQRSDVVPYLEGVGVDHLDLLVVTHPHADHIGQFDQVVDAVTVDEVWWSGSTTTTGTFERAVDALERSGAAYEEPRAGDRADVGPITIDVVNPPAGVDLGDLHDANLSFTVTYGEVSVLLTGDAEAATERRMVETAGGRLAADILQLGHHGSSTSTIPDFLEAVDPKIAVYSAGEGNQYGHPHAEVIDRVQAAGIELYGTDVHGHVVVTIDGSGWSVETRHSGSVTAAPPAPSSAGPAPDDEVEEAPQQSEEEAPPSSAEGCGSGQIDLNTASFDELQGIIQIGADRAQQIIDLRPFASVDQLTRVSGIAEGRLAEIVEEGIACVG